MTRNWSLGQAAWAWPDDVDETGCDRRMADRYLSVEHTEYGGSGWQVAKVFVDEDDMDMLDDARLIAAAPELLDAARLANQELIDLGQGSSASPALRALWSAIAKAEGRASETTPD